MKTGIKLIATERRRQITQEGFTAAHDGHHKFGELSKAARAYCQIATIQIQFAKSAMRFAPPLDWPWEKRWFKPSRDPVRNLVKAAALIAA